MKKEIKRKINKQKGAAMLISVVFFLFISLSIITGLVSPTVRGFKNSNVNLNSKQSYFLAESGNEDALYRILNNMVISDNEIIMLNSHSVTTTVNTLMGNIKEIISLGDVVNLQRKINLRLQTGDGVVFKYGTQAGLGGFVFRNNSFVNGNLYSNGNVVGANGAYVTGDVYVAGDSGSINNMRVGYGGTGHAHANSVTNSTVTGTIYCQTGSGNNKSCDTGEANPPFEDLPISDEMITEWKDDATNGGMTNGNMTISTPTTLGPVKIEGNLTVDSTLTIAGTIYVTGNLIINVNKTVKLDFSFGDTSGIIVVDGYIVINNGVEFEDSGTEGSYILFLSDSNCDASMSGSPCNGNNAIDVSNNSDISIVNAQKGTVYFSNNAAVKEAVGNKIELKNNVGIQYGSGLINVDFSSGPSGGWEVQMWKEVE